MASTELKERVGRLAKLFPENSEELRLALQYFETDAASSLNKCRTILERLLRVVYTQEMGQEPRKSLIGDMLVNNQFTKKIERRILSRMHAIRDMGNVGSHGYKVKPKDAERVIEDLCDVLEWYVPSYAPSALAPQKESIGTIIELENNEQTSPGTSGSLDWLVPTYPERAIDSPKEGIEKVAAVEKSTEHTSDDTSVKLGTGRIAVIRNLSRFIYRSAIARCALLGILLATGVGLVGQAPAVRGLNDELIDNFFVWRGPRTSRQKVILVALDDASLDKLHKPTNQISPELAEVIAFLRKQEADAVGVDFIIPESLQDSPELQAGKPGDVTKMGLAVSNAGRNVVLTQWLLETGWLRPPPQWLLKQLTEPTSTGLAFVDLSPDPDNVIRRQQVYATDGKSAYVHFALALVSASRGEEPEWKDDHLFLESRPIPLDEQQRLRINYVGAPGTVFSVLPFHKVLSAARGGSKLQKNPKGAIVIIGATAKSLQDYHATPYASNLFRSSTAHQLMAGSELVANVVATLVDQSYLWTLPGRVSMISLVAIGGLLGVIFARINLLLGMVLAILFQCASIAAGFAAFQYANLCIEVVPILIAGLLVYAAVFVVRWQSLQRKVAMVSSV